MFEQRIKELERENQILKEENLRYKKLLESKSIISETRTSSQRIMEIHDTHTTPETGRRRDYSTNIPNSKAMVSRDLYTKKFTHDQTELDSRY